jgi:hypothetical protein
MSKAYQTHQDDEESDGEGKELFRFVCGGTILVVHGGVVAASGVEDIGAVFGRLPHAPDSGEAAFPSAGVQAARV